MVWNAWLCTSGLSIFGRKSAMRSARFRGFVSPVRISRNACWSLARPTPWIIRAVSLTREATRRVVRAACATTTSRYSVRVAPVTASTRSSALAVFTRASGGFFARAIRRVMSSAVIGA